MIALDQREVLTVCSMTAEIAEVEDVCLSLPWIIGAGGVEDTLVPAMTQAEGRALGALARMLKETSDAVAVPTDR